MAPRTLALAAALALPTAAQADPTCLTWTTSERRLLAPSDARRDQPDVTWLDDASMLVAWRDGSPAGAPAALILDEALAVVQGPFLPLGDGANAVAVTAVRTEAGGQAMWTRQDGLVWWRAIGADGTMSPPRPLATDAQERPGSTDLVTTAGPFPFAAWRVDAASDSSDDVPPWAGAALSDAFGLLPTADSTPNSAPVSLAATSGGAGSWLLWSDGSAILGVPRTDKGWGARVTLAEAVGEASLLRAVGDTPMAITWRTDGQAQLLRVAPDAPDGAERSTLGPSTGATSITAEGARWVASWSVEDRGHTEVRIRVDGCDAQPAHARWPMADDQPVVALAPNGIEGVVLWRREERNGGTSLWARRFVLRAIEAAPAEAPPADR